jgi:hypothetical protein
MLNSDQHDHMRALVATPLEVKCYCGWWLLSESYRACRCPDDMSSVDKMRMRCEVCGNAPDPRSMRLVHLSWCTAEHRHALAMTVGERFDLGGEG